MSEESERGGLPIRLFADRQALEAWLERQPADHKGIWLKLAKKDAGVSSVTLKEAVDSGLCFGWIDGLINRFDERFYLIRYTPRRPRSKWSEVNVRRAEELLAEGRVRPGGMRQIEAARADGRWDAAYPPASRIAVPDDLAAALKASDGAEAAWQALRAAERYSVLYRLHSINAGDKRRAAIARTVADLGGGG